MGEKSDCIVLLKLNISVLSPKQYRIFVKFSPKVVSTSQKKDTTLFF